MPRCASSSTGLSVIAPCRLLRHSRLQLAQHDTQPYLLDGTERWSNQSPREIERFVLRIGVAGYLAMARSITLVIFQCQKLSSRPAYATFAPASHKRPATTSPRVLSRCRPQRTSPR